MPKKKYGKPINPDNYPDFPIIVIRWFAHFYTTAQILDSLEDAQKEGWLKKVHQSRNKLREMIRTFNPHNAKFNRAKWGDLLDECRQEFLDELRTQMAQTAVKTANLLHKMIENASIQQIHTIKDLHEYVKLLNTFKKLNSDSNDEIAQALNAGILPQPSIEMLQTETLKTEMLQPGMNGQSETG